MSGAARVSPGAGAVSLRCAGAARSRQSTMGTSRLPAPVLYSSSPLTVRLSWRMTGSRTCRRSRPRIKPGGSRWAELRLDLGVDARLRQGTGTMCSRRSGQVGLDLVPRGGFDRENHNYRPRFFELPISTTEPSTSASVCILPSWRRRRRRSPPEVPGWRTPKTLWAFLREPCQSLSLSPILQLMADSFLGAPLSRRTTCRVCPDRGRWPGRPLL